MKGSDFIFDFINLLLYKCDNINLNWGGSYMDSLNWIKNKKGTINPINDHGKYFQYAATVTLNHKEVGKKLQRISKIKPFIYKYKYNWK